MPLVERGGEIKLPALGLASKEWMADMFDQLLNAAFFGCRRSRRKAVPED
jgi:hypothetical protein